MKPPSPPPEPALLLEHADFVRALARSLIRDPAGADDVVQETWLRALEHGPRESSNPRGWLATVLTNLARNRARSNSRRLARERAAERTDAAAGSAPPSSLAAEQSDTLRSVVAAVVSLDEPYRATIFALYFQGLSAREFAQQSAQPEATVRSRHRRALALLRERLDGEFGGRARWCSALAGLTGLESGAALSTPALAAATVALAVAAIVGAGAWFTRRAVEPQRESALAASELAREATPDAAAAPSDSTEAAARSETDATQRSELAPGEIRVTGVVSDARDVDGQRPADAVRDAAVSLRIARVAPGMRGNRTVAQAEVRSDDAGRFEWRVADSGERPLELTASVKANGTHRAASVSWKLEAPSDRSDELELVRTLHGDVEMRVEGPTGAPLRAALVRVLKQDNATTLETATDAAGLARFENLDNFGLFTALAPGWTPVRFEAPKQRREGGWTPGRIAMAPDGALRVKVFDGRGAPLAGARVRVVRAPWERDPEGDAQWGAPRALGDLSRTSDERGEALFESVCAGADLRITVEHAKQTLVAEQRTSEGRLLESKQDGLAIRVAPGGETQVEARWTGALSLEFTLRRADAAPLGEVFVQVVDAGRPVNDANRVLGEARYSSPREAVRGAFDVLDIVGPLVVFATDESREDQGAHATQGLGYLGSHTAPSPSFAVARVELPRPAIELARGDTTNDAAPNHVAAEPLRVELVFEPCASLSGRLIARDGAPAQHRSGGMGGHKIHVVPAGGSRATANNVVPQHANVSYSGEADFVVHGLARGRYDVLVTEEIDRFYTFSGAVHRFAGLEAGASGLELRLGETGRVEVRLTTDADPELASSMIVLMGALAPADEASLGGARAPARQVVAGNSPWPSHAPRHFSGAGGGRDDVGLWSFGCDPVDSVAAAELPPLAPGWYVFGVHPSGADGRPYAPIATRSAYFEAGEYELDFRLTRVSDVRGVVRRGADKLTALELLDARGQLTPFLQFDGDGRSVTRQFVGASGAVRLRDVPHGAYRLRAGSPAQLDRGAFAAELELVVDAATPPFEIELP
jgi:RNA polymerase sigma-70 factor (ECF subfamily)